MTDEMKLLRAFIEASGYEVEVTETFDRHYRPCDIMRDGGIKENAMPVVVCKNHDYKVTKRDSSTSNSVIKNIGGLGKI